MPLPVGLPQHTLGWGVLDWCTENLAHPDGDNRGGQWVFTNEQAQFVLWFYAVDAQGRFCYRRALLGRPKGWGKSPFVASIAAAELLGPTQFAGWNASRSPVGKPFASPIVQIFAISESQIDNSYDPLKVMLSEGNAIKNYSLNVMETKIVAPGRGVIERVTASPRSREGRQTTFSLADEALALDTPIPTPSGWTTMGQIIPGDFILGSKGRPVRVCKVTEILENRECFEVSFPDRTSFVTSAGHMWWAQPSGCFPRIMTTEEMAKHKRVYIPRSPIIDLPDQDIPIDPYILGYWLGDGNSYSGEITVHALDLESLIKNVGEAGFERHSVIEYYDSPGNFRVRPFGLQTLLRQQGILKNKHVPEVYLRASMHQRLALLQGLMDSDGSASRTQGTFANLREDLTDAVVELARSLGFRVTKTSKDGVFWAYIQGDRSLFRIPRKQDKILCSQNPAWQRVRINQVESVPVRCIAVEAEDHLFLAGAFKPTHNTHLWVPAEKGPELAAVMRRNLAKKNGRSIETTNAPQLGQGSVAEKSYDAATKAAEGLLFDSREAFCDDIYDRGQFMSALEDAYGDSYWVNKERLWAEVNDPASDEWDMKRFYLNQRVQGEFQWLKAGAWQNCQRSNLQLGQEDRICLGFRAKKDAAALVATRLSDNALFCVGFWEKPDDAAKDWAVPFHAIDNRVRTLLSKHNVHSLYAMPKNWQDTVGHWYADFEDQVDVKEFWTTTKAKMAKAIEQFETAVYTQRVLHPGDTKLTRHVMNAHALDTPQGKLIQQETAYSSRYIVAAEAAVLSYEAAQAAIEDGALKEPPDNYVFSF